MTKDAEKIKDAVEILKELERHQTDLIADLSGIKGGEITRQAYAYHRKHVMDAISLLENGKLYDQR